MPLPGPSQVTHDPRPICQSHQGATVHDAYRETHEHYSRTSKIPSPVAKAGPSYEQPHSPYGPAPSPPFASGQEPPIGVGHIVRHLHENPSGTSAEPATFQFVSGHKKYPEEMLTGPVRRTAKKIRQRKDSPEPHTEERSTRTLTRPYERADPILDRPDNISRESKVPSTGSLPTPDRRASQQSTLQGKAPIHAVPHATPTFTTINYTPSNPTPKTPVPKMEPVRSVSISDLISEAPKRQAQRKAPSLHPSLTLTRSEPIYNLVIRQQPVAARACGFGERDRRVIDPPPILQMTVEDPYATKEEIRSKLRDQYSVVHCALYHAEHDESDSLMPETGERRQQRRLMGQLVASPFYGVDENGKEGSFFCFPDLSCRTSGKYRLEFKLVILNPENPKARHPCPSVIISQVFQVFAAKDFPGMQESTPLTKKLKQQGCQISVKKGNTKKDGRGGDDGPSNHRPEYDDDEDDADEDDEEEEDDEPGEEDDAPATKTKIKIRVAKARTKRQRK